MDYKPVFRRLPGSTELMLKCSVDASCVSKASKERPKSKMANKAKVEADAQARVREGGGDPRDRRLVLSQRELQFGQYRGQTFHWLLSNDLGFAVMVVAAHQKERESGVSLESPLMENKEALDRYVGLFPEVVSAIRRRRIGEGSLVAPQEEDSRLVGFGKHAALTYKELYDSTVPELVR